VVVANADGDDDVGTGTERQSPENAAAVDGASRAVITTASGVTAPRWQRGDAGRGGLTKSRWATRMSAGWWQRPPRPAVGRVWKARQS